MIVVIGATGKQSGSVVETSLNDPNWKIRSLTRDINGAAPQALKAQGVEMMSENLDDMQSLVAAFRGAHTIFSVTDFWNGFFNPANRTMSAPEQTMLEWAHDYELQHRKNVFTAAAQTPTLERLIFSAPSYATKWWKGKYRRVYHFDSEARAVEFARSSYPDLMEKSSLIQLGLYLSNMLRMPRYKPKKVENGIYTFSTKIPGDRQLPLVAANEDTGPLVKALVTVEPGKHLLAYKEWMSMTEFVKVWGEVHGVRSKHVTISPENEWEELPDELRIDIEDGAGYLGEFGFDGGDPSTIHPRDLGTPVDLGSVSDWIRGQDWTAVLEGQTSQPYR